MSYNNNIPQSTDKIKDSQAALLANFQALKQLIDINHGTFSAADEGKHKWVTMPNQAAAPATGAAEIALYAKLVGGASQLFMRKESSGAESNFTSATTSTTNGTTTLPSGIIIKWGRATSDAAGLSTVTFTTAFPTGILTAYAVTATVSGSSPSSESTDRFTRVFQYANASMNVVTYIQKSTRTRVAQEFTWFAIGY